MKTKVLKLHNFLQREFYPDSRQYFNKRFYLAYESIIFNKNGVIHWDNKSEFKFISLTEQYSFIEKLILCRQKTNTLEDYCDISYGIIKDHFNRLRKDNILYTSNPFESKQEVFANNVVKHKRRDFFNSLESILSNIEKNYSIDLEKNNSESRENTKQTRLIKKKAKSEYNLIVVKYMILDKFKKTPFEYFNYTDRNNKIIKKESNLYKTLVSTDVVKNTFNKISNFEIFLREDKNSDYIDVLKQDVDIVNEKEIILFLDKLKKNKKKN